MPAPEANLDLTKVRYEAFYNHFEPCYHAAVLYVRPSFWRPWPGSGWSGLLNRASFGLLSPRSACTCSC